MATFDILTNKGSFLIKLLVTLTAQILITTTCWRVVSVNAAYPPGFYNHTCLYTYMLDGQYKVTIPDVPEPQFGSLPLNKLTYDPKASCVDGKYRGNLVLNFDLNDNNMQSISLDLQISGKSNYWDMDKITMKITPNNKAQYPETTFQMRPQNDIYASDTNSFSCSSLVLVNYPPSSTQFKIILKRFQVQPFGESPLYVFAPSHDCSVWLTLPQVMGFALVLFIIFTALFGVYLLLALGNQQGDLRFSKQGGMLMNQAQLDATKAD